jgi:hypothetical protein
MAKRILHVIEGGKVVLAITYTPITPDTPPSTHDLAVSVRDRRYGEDPVRLNGLLLSALTSVVDEMNPGDGGDGIIGIVVAHTDSAEN